MAFFRSAPRRRGSTTSLDPWQLLRHHSDALAAAARDILSQLPDAQLAGLIVAPGSRQGEALRVLLAECHGATDPDRVCVGIVPRARIHRLLDGLAAGSATEGMHAAPQQLLPIVVATAIGLRCGSVPCAEGTAAD